MLLITGATGSIGSELCCLLAAEHIPSRAMYRKEDQRNRFQALGLEAVRADFNDADSMRQAMRSCDQVFLLTPPDPGHAEREITTINLAIELDIQHIVKISTANTNPSSPLAYARSHAQIDQHLRNQPIDWTILRPTGFMQNFTQLLTPSAKESCPTCSAMDRLVISIYAILPWWPNMY